jgi:hypothetical protein
MDSASRSSPFLGSPLIWMRVFQLLVSSEWFDAIMTLTRWRSQYLHLEGGTPLGGFRSASPSLPY